MVGADKPNRSEEQGTLEEQQHHAEQVRAHLDATAPKRELKPARSDAEEQFLYSNTNSDSNASDPPEHAKYLHLVATGAPLDTQGAPGSLEDYTESEYYRHMAAIDKAHHTTGSGFIKMDMSPEGFQLAEGHPHGVIGERRRGNPAMNDWEPAAGSAAVASSKPLRSESGCDL